MTGREPAAVRARILRSRYVDSLVLMRLAQKLSRYPGVDDAAAVMGTPPNLATLRAGGYSLDDLATAQPDDVVVAVRGRDRTSLDQALEGVEELLAADGTAALPEAPTLAAALQTAPRTNLVSISVPGEYAATLSRAALEAGRHVFCFSSGVTVEDEVALKQLAADKGLLCMGPDCGTAIINGAGLGFANAVQRGPVGLVGASGTGLQAVSTLLDAQGIGISHAIGTGSRDLHDAVGGQTTVAALHALDADPATAVIGLISKPPDPRTSLAVRAAAAGLATPVVTCFLGDPSSDALTFDELVKQLTSVVGATYRPPGHAIDHADRLRDKLGAQQRWIRGLYSGGSLCAEAQVVLSQGGLEVYSNSPIAGAALLPHATSSCGHALIDLGTEEFTRGRPHPMIDPRTRLTRLVEESERGDVAVILLDVVLGRNAATDPAADLSDAIDAARAQARRRGGDLVVLATVVGTAADPQDHSRQVRQLRAAGALVLPTNAAAAALAADIVTGGRS